MPAWRTISLWMDQLDEPLLARAALEQDLDVDVAIIGAGYTGLWTAYYLKRQAPGLNIVIIEAQTAGFGASGRNGGWLMGNLLGEDRLLASLSPEQRRASYDLLHDIPDEVKSVIEREGIDCDYRKGGALYCAARYPEQEATLRQYLDKLYSQGLNENDYRLPTPPPRLKTPLWTARWPRWGRACPWCWPPPARRSTAPATLPARRGSPPRRRSPATSARTPSSSQ